MSKLQKIIEQLKALQETWEERATACSESESESRQEKGEKLQESADSLTEAIDILEGIEA